MGKMSNRGRFICGELMKVPIHTRDGISTVNDKRYWSEKIMILYIKCVIR
jgi:hypothetical protein